MNFGAKFAQKGCFRSKMEKLNRTIVFHVFVLVLVLNYSLNRQCSFFCTKYAQKGCSQSNAEKGNLTIEFCIFEYFTLSKQFWILEWNLAKKVFPIENRITEHHQWYLRVRICLGTKFQLKRTIWNFWTKFAQKGYFWSNKQKITLCIRPWSLLY